MPNIAIIVGNTNYDNLANLECCKADIDAINELLKATEKFETIEIIENANANDLKEKIRAIVDKANSPNELFFYYTGHGYSCEGEFFHCATNFNPSKPNESGLSTDDLHTFLRLANADLVIKVIDACNSGTHLLKADVGLTQQSKQGFKNLIQISSCLDSQSSLTGNPLSLFTQKFRDSALSKTEGIIYYTDVISVLRDQFIGNENQIPFFVSQYTGREQFADDARKLDKLRAILKPDKVEVLSVSTETDLLPALSPPTLVELLLAAESKLVTPDVMNPFVSDFLDKLKSNLEKTDFAELFQLEFTEHHQFEEPTAKPFIIEVLSREKRSDNFVRAEYSRKLRKTNPLFGAVAAFSMFHDDDDYIEKYDLELNCEMPRAQLKIMLTPKFSTLQRLALVISCAPSLEKCYLFEVVTQHMLCDFGRYDSEGIKVTKRWYKLDWKQNTDYVIKKISDNLATIVKNHIESTMKRIEDKD